MGLKINTKSGAMHIIPQDGAGLIETLIPRTAELASNQLDNVDNDIFLSKASNSGVLRGFKNRIINGDFQVNQRNNPVLDNDSDYVCDRVFIDSVNAKIVATTEDIYSLNEGSLVTNTDPFGDGSQNNLYQFDSNSNDANGNNNGADTKVDYVSGKFGGCLYTDQDNTSHVELNGIPKIFDETNKTFSCWVYYDDSTKLDAIICSAMDSNKNSGRVDIKSDKIEVENGTYIYFPKIIKNKWNHMLFTVDSSGTKIYTNGNLVATDSRTIINDSGTASYDAYAIGNHWYNIANNNIGTPNLKIDQLRIFNRALTEDEVKKLYVEDLEYIQKKHLKVQVDRKDSNSNINPYAYKFEGQHVQELLNNDMTLSFEMLAPTGTYNTKLVTECLDGTTEEFTGTFDFNGSDFTKQSITIPKGTFTKKIINDERLGATLYIANSCDSNVNVGDTIRITNVQLEKGDVATEFEVLPYETQLERCMRYYEECLYGVDYYSNNENFSIPIEAEILKSKRNIPSTNIIILNRTDSDVIPNIEFTNSYKRFRADDTSSNAPRSVSIHTKCKFDAEL